MMDLDAKKFTTNEILVMAGFYENNGMDKTVGSILRQACKYKEDAELATNALSEIVRINENVWSPRQEDRIANIARKALSEIHAQKSHP